MNRTMSIAAAALARCAAAGACLAAAGDTLADVGLALGQAEDGARQAPERSSSSKRPAPGKPVVGADPFRDQFDSVAADRWKVSDGWRNGEWTVNDWRASQASADGKLRLTLAPNTTNLAKFSSGEVQSNRNYGHGYYEAKMRAAPGSGTVSGFFTYTGPPFGQPWDEIDVEILGGKPREVLLTYFRDGEKVSHKHRLDFDATKEEHVYGFDWQPGHIRWYIDGKMVHEATGEGLPLPIIRQKIMVSLWGSRQLKSWVGPFDPAMLPVSMTVDCISYSRTYAAREACG